MGSLWLLAEKTNVVCVNVGIKVVIEAAYSSIVDEELLACRGSVILLGTTKLILYYPN